MGRLHRTVGALLVVVVALAGAADPQRLTTLRWRAPRQQATDLGKQLVITPSAAPGSETDTKGLPLFYVLAGTVAVAKVAEAIVRIYRDVRWGGVVVTLRDEIVEIENDQRIPGGLVIVNSEKGVEMLKTDAPDATKLVEILTNIATARPTPAR